MTVNKHLTGCPGAKSFFAIFLMKKAVFLYHLAPISMQPVRSWKVLNYP